MDERLRYPYDSPVALTLYVTGASLNSVRAIEAVTAVCEQYLAGKYELQIIDVHQQPEVAAEEQIIALPLLVKTNPPPERRLIGDMRDLEKVLRALGIEPDTDDLWPKE